MKKYTYSIIICAYDEEKNIGFLLDDILRWKLDDKIILENIIIVSDGSTDKTNEIVMECLGKNKGISLIVNKKRLGKASSFNIGKEKVSSDFLISLDADVRLENNKTISALLDIEDGENIGLVGGQPVPMRDKSNIAVLASFFSYNLVYDIKKQIKNGNNFYSAHGRILALSRGLYEEIEIPDLPGTDQFMYFSCLKNGLKFVYQEESRVFYKVPSEINDYLKQGIRFRRAGDLMSEVFGKKFVNTEILIPLVAKIKSITLVALRHPIQFFFWVMLYLVGKIKYRLISKEEYFSSKWIVSRTTK